ncbi:hypothetical protein DFH28DRAFT_526377 [Melampsora americana]|nr:hypothetical protein DFH28DRAFT_526377 [Melampsora americana]
MRVTTLSIRTVSNIKRCYVFGLIIASLLDHLIIHHCYLEIDHHLFLFFSMSSSAKARFGTRNKFVWSFILICIIHIATMWITTGGFRQPASRVFTALLASQLLSLFLPSTSSLIPFKLLSKFLTWLTQ